MTHDIENTYNIDVKTEEIIDYYLQAVRIREIERYGHLAKKFRNNVAEHCFMMIVLADKLIAHYNFDLDFRKVVRYIYLHDWGEIGMKQDIPAVTKSKGDNRDLVKQKEFQNATALLSEFGLSSDIADYQSYENLETEESKFVMALDKLECPLFIIKSGLDNIITSCIKNGVFKNKGFTSVEHIIDFEVNYPKKAIALYPPIKDFAEAIMNRIKQQVARFKLQN